MNRERFSLRALYLYAVCLITLLVTLFSTAQIVRSAVELAYPDPYSGYWAGCSPEVSDAECAEMEADAEKDAARAADSQKRWAVLSLVGSVTTTALAVPTYLYHWRRVQKDRAEALADDGS